MMTGRTCAVVAYAQRNWKKRRKHEKDNDWTSMKVCRMTKDGIASSKKAGRRLMTKAGLMMTNG